jgi:hypothetical protein
VIHLNKFNKSKNNRDEPTYYYIQDLLVDISDEFEVKIYQDSLSHQKIQTFLIDVYLGFSVQDIKDDKENLEGIDNSIRDSKKLFDCWNLIHQFLSRIDVDSKFTILVADYYSDNGELEDFIRIDLKIPKQK